MSKKQTGARQPGRRASASKVPPPQDGAREKTSVYLRPDHYQWLLDYRATYFDRTKERVTITQLIDMAMDLLIAECQRNTNFVSARMK